MARETAGEALRELKAFLEVLPLGPVEDSAELGKLLAAAWGSLAGSRAGGMEAYKLTNRVEKVVWSPPYLRFRIERHGGAVQGSSRAELQGWQVNLVKQEAQIIESGVRQLSPLASRLDLAPMVEDLADQIAMRAAAPALVWLPEGAVRVLIGKVLPAGTAVPQTLAGRRRRFWNVLGSKLEPRGWVQIRRGTFEKKGPAPQDPDRSAT